MLPSPRPVEGGATGRRVAARRAERVPARPQRDAPATTIAASTDYDPAAALCADCARTSEQLRGDPGAGHELFRRALCARDQQAWSALYVQYRGLVMSWVRQHPAARFDQDDDYWISRAFERLWTAVGPERFAQFPTLASVLQYLKLCVHSVLVDERRAERAVNGPTPPVDLAAAEHLPAGGDIAASVLDRVSHDALFRAVVAEATDEAEQTVLVLSFARDLRPREIYARRPDLYPTVDDVYRVKRNLIDRLRRSPQILLFANGLA
jgi:hypothetical protein